MSGEPLICGIKDCGALATHQAEIVVYASVARLHTPAIGTMGIGVCAAHATEENARALLDEPGKRKIEDGFRRIGRALPDWTRSFVRWSKKR